MEIEKKRETSWKIQLNKKFNKIRLTSVEISGEVRLIKLGVINDEDDVQVEMNKEEFTNFLSLISAFKDVVMGNTYFLKDENFDLTIENDISQEDEFIESKKTGEYPNTEKNEELNPKDWDPW